MSTPALLIRCLLITLLGGTFVPGFCLAEDELKVSKDWSLSQVVRMAGAGKTMGPAETIQFLQNGHLVVRFLAPDGNTKSKVTPEEDWKYHDIVKAVATIVNFDAQHMTWIFLKGQDWLEVETASSWEPLTGGGMRLELRRDKSKGWMVVSHSSFDS